jgi:hypothetical protein
MSTITTRAPGQITTAAAITIVLVELEDMPSSIINHWPSQSMVCHPRRFTEVAAAAMKVLAAAVTRYNQIKAARR